MPELVSLYQELHRKGRDAELDVAALEALAAEWKTLRAHAEFPTAPRELQAAVIAGLARTLRRIAMARKDFALFDEALPLLREAQKLSRETDVDDHIEYRLDELRFRIERFTLSHERNDIWEAMMCGIRFGVATGGHVHTIGSWTHPGPLRWGPNVEDCDFDGAGCRNLLGNALYESYKVFHEGADLDLAIGYYQISLPAARLDWEPLRQHALNLAETLLVRFRRVHWYDDAVDAVAAARRAVTEIPKDETPSSAARASLALALFANHATSDPDTKLREAIAWAKPLGSDPRVVRMLTVARLVRAAEWHDLSFWIARPSAELALEAGEHLLLRFGATNEIALLEAALKLLRLALSHSESPAMRALVNCRLAEGLTRRGRLLHEKRLADSNQAEEYARAAIKEAGDDPNLLIQANFALAEALVRPFRTESDPLKGLLGAVYPPAGNSTKAALAYEAAAKSEAAQFQRQAIEAGLKWSEIAVQFDGWPETAEAMRHSVAAFERFLAQRPCRIEMLEALHYFYGTIRRAAFALAAVGDFAGSIAVIERMRGILNRPVEEVGSAREWIRDLSDYAGEIIPEAAQARDLRRAAMTPEQVQDELPVGFNMREVAEADAEARWNAQVRDGRLDRSPLRKRVLQRATEAARNGAVVYLIPETWGLMLIINREGEVKALWPDFLRHPEMITEVRAFYERYQERGASPAAFEAFRQAFERLSTWLWKSVVRHLSSAVSSDKKIIMVATGTAGMLPLAMARPANEKNAEAPYALDEFEITYTPTVETYLRAQSAAAKRQAESALIVDEPTSSRESFRLRGGERSIVQHFIPEATLLSGAAADFASVSRHIVNHDIVHFSAHGEAYPDDPMRSGIVLADDQMLTVGDLGGGIELEKTRMVVISACESATIGRTMPDESLGLPMALLAAQIPGVLGTLWSVREHDAFFITLGFYLAWLGEKKTPAAALREAQRWVRDSTNEEKVKALQQVLPADVRNSEGFVRLVAKLKLTPQERAFSHPVHWAAFVFNGV